MIPRRRALLLAAGEATRLRPFSDILPKCLAPLGGVPLLNWQAASLAAAGVTDVRITVRPHSHMTRSYIRELGSLGNLRWELVDENIALGTGGAVLEQRKWLSQGHESIVLNADTILWGDWSAAFARHRTSKATSCLLLFRAENPSDCGIVELTESGLISDIVEKPSHPSTNLANAGALILTPSSLSGFSQVKRCDLARDILPKLTPSLLGVDFAGYCRDIGSPPALIAANLDFKNGAISLPTEMRVPFDSSEFRAVLAQVRLGVAAVELERSQQVAAAVFG